jgi:hypothetical protein
MEANDPSLQSKIQNHQSSIINHQSSIINHQSAISIHPSCQLAWRLECRSGFAAYFAEAM